jgi:6-pyruvoyltetrahydropterin/6-carboxytetrahydropterin synthase
MNKTYSLFRYKEIQIDCGHCLLDHEGQCQNVHGHRYRFDLYITDTGEREESEYLIEDVVRGWLLQHWDHGMLLNRNDPKALCWAPGGPLYPDKYYLLPCNPTAENLSSFVLEKAGEIAQSTGLHQKVTRIVCWETPNCSSTAELA